MAEYVDREAFREHLDSVPPFTKYEQRDPKYNFAKTVFLSELAAYPAADVAPVRHGRWQITDPYPHNVYCSECHKRFAQTHWAVWEDGSLPRAYCPNCGAKMEVDNGL